MEIADKMLSARLRLKSLRRPILALLATWFAAGCGKEPAAVPGTPATKPNSTSEASMSSAETSAATLTAGDLAVVSKASKPYKILLIVKTLNNPFFKPMVAAFKQTAAELGVQGDIQAAPQETDVDKQAALVQNAAAQGYQAVCITPADSKALVPSLKAAADKGLVIINVDNRLDPETVKSSGLVLGGYVGADNRDGGKLAGEAMVSALDGKGNVVVIEGIRGVDNAEARKHGFEDAVKDKLVVLDEQSADWMTEKAEKVMQNLLAAHSDIHGVFCANDEMAIGAIKAIKSMGRSGSVKVVSYDNIKEVQPYLKSHELYATIEQHPDQMGAQALRMAVGILESKVKKGGSLLVTLEAMKYKP